ncbi:hypothetical protein LINGRAHAP2_LOCUS7439 [Linum grandiflorum]
MEQNLPLMTKKAWGIVRVLFFMLRKGIISKRKLLLDLNMVMKRGNKIASKAIGNFLMFNHHHRNDHSTPASSSSPTDYEFSCSNTPNYTFPFHLPTTKRRNQHHHNSSFLSCSFHAPPTMHDDDDQLASVDTVNAVKMALEMFNNTSNLYAPSPMLPGFGKSPMGRQLRITDSPFPLREEDHGDNGVVDQKAGEFIANFYRELQKQRGIMD